MQRAVVLVCSGSWDPRVGARRVGALHRLPSSGECNALTECQINTPRPPHIHEARLRLFVEMQCGVGPHYFHFVVRQQPPPQKSSHGRSGSSRRHAIKILIPDQPFLTYHPTPLAGETVVVGTWTSSPVPCETFLTTAGEGSFFPLPLLAPLRQASFVSMDMGSKTRRSWQPAPYF